MPGKPWRPGGHPHPQTLIVQTPEWALLLSFWLHMLATVLWLGGLAAFVLLMLPGMRRSLEAKHFADWLRATNRRLDSIGWISLALLTATGLIQMSANPNYDGLFIVNNGWALAICLKHIAFGGMLVVSAYSTWGLSPALQRAALLRATVGDEGQEAPLLARLQRLIALNLILGVVVLAFTALARIA